MAVKRYNGSSWDVVAGVGAQGAAATSSTITTWVKTAAGGETSLSGNDDSSQSLSYTIGQELVFINGVLQKRNDDYVANTGNSITGLTALTAGDIVSVWTVNAFSVSNAISNTIVDAKGDILVGTAADTPGRLAVGTNGQVLTAASTTGTGLTWATPASGLTFISTHSFTSSSQVNIDNVFTSTYDNYRILIYNLRGSSNNALWLRLRASGTTSNTGYYLAGNGINTSGTAKNAFDANSSILELVGPPIANDYLVARLDVYTPQLAQYTTFNYQCWGDDGVTFIGRSGSANHRVATAYDGFSMSLNAGGNITGNVTIYGYQKS